VSQLLSISEVCRRLGVSRQTVHRKHSAGELAFVTVGSRSLVDECELDRFIAQHTDVVGTTEPLVSGAVESLIVQAVEQGFTRAVSDPVVLERVADIVRGVASELREVA
jgi:excisionase family DNA binding protein